MVSEPSDEASAPLVRKPRSGCCNCDMAPVAATLMRQLLRYMAWSSGYKLKSCHLPSLGRSMSYFERPGKSGDLLPPLVVLHGFSANSRITLASKLLSNMREQ